MPNPSTIAADEEGCLGWHFLSESRRLRHEDGRLVVPGETLTVHSEPELCERGLHASKRLIDAMKYAPGPIVCRVRISGTVIHGDDKFVGTERAVLWMADATDCLRLFARRCALDVLHLWDAPDAVVRYLETSDESLRDAAWDAAWNAAWNAAAARDAAWATVRDAAWATAWATVRDAAWAAARGIVRATVRDAAWAAAWDAARATARDAAWSATWSATWNTARDKQNHRLTAMVAKLPREVA